jgi:hypothetical protein
MNILSSVLLCDIDCLLDTRLAVLFRYNKDSMSKVFNDKYFTRNSDLFLDYTLSEFNALYATRTIDDLRQAIITPISKMITEFVISTLAGNGNQPVDVIPKVWLNTYPYKLTAEDDKYLIKKLMQLTMQKCDIRLINKSVDELTPNYLKVNDITVFCKYDFNEWLERLSEINILSNQSCPEIVMFSAGLDKKGDRCLFTTRHNNVSAAQLIELIAQPFIGLKLLPVKDFCVDTSLITISNPPN